MAAMAVRVFGRPISDGTRAQRAQTALKQQNAGGKLDEVLAFEKEILGGGKLFGAAPGGGGGKVVATVSSTFGRIYNATGDPIKLLGSHDWKGKALMGYPVEIQNGQWAVACHVGTKGKGYQGSVAGVVYAIQDVSDVVLAWKNPWKTDDAQENNKAYCEMMDAGSFSTDQDKKWDAIKAKLDGPAAQNESDSTLSGYAIKVSIEKGSNTPSFTATFY